MMTRLCLFCSLLLCCVGCKAATLESVSLTSAAMSFGDADKVCPGDRVPLIIDVELADGQSLRSEGAGKGDVSLESFELKAERGVIEEGVVYLNAPPEQYLGAPAIISGHVVGHPEKTMKQSLPVSFGCAYEADFMGRDADESFQAGAQGGNGPALTVKVTTQNHPESAAPLLHVDVKAEDGRTGTWIVDPAQRGSLVIMATGGRGADGVPGKKGGDGGGGSVITLDVSPEAKPMMSAITLENIGGIPGGGPDGKGAPGKDGSVKQAPRVTGQGDVAPQ